MTDPNPGTPSPRALPARNHQRQRNMTDALTEICRLSVLPPGWRLPLPDGVVTTIPLSDELLRRLQEAVAIAEDALAKEEGRR